MGRSFADLPALGSYEPLVKLASGGMGVVYVGRKVGDAGFERLVAIKRVHRHLLEDREYSDMLRAEARVSSLVRHANVVSVIDVVDAGGELSLVLDYVESLSLAQLLASLADRGERLPVRVATRILADALAGLHATHDAVDPDGAPLGLIHRDVSPENILVGLDGTSRLIDFGLAKATAGPTHTSRDVLKGKLRYMPPEQVKQQPLDRRADVYSAAAVLHEAITGRRLFTAKDDGDLVLGILIGEVLAPGAIVPDVPETVDAAIVRALSRDRDERFATAAELAEALETATPAAPARDVSRLVEEHGGAMLAARRAELRDASRARGAPASLPAPAPASAASTPAAPDARDARSPGAPRARRRLYIAVAAAVLVPAAAIAGARLHARSSAPKGPEPAADAGAQAIEKTAITPPAADVNADAAPPRSASPPGRGRPPRRPDLHRNPYGRP